MKEENDESKNLKDSINAFESKEELNTPDKTELLHIEIIKNLALELYSKAVKINSLQQEIAYLKNLNAEYNEEKEIDDYFMKNHAQKETRIEDVPEEVQFPD